MFATITFTDLVFIFVTGVAVGSVATISAYRKVSAWWNRTVG